MDGKLFVDVNGLYQGQSQRVSQGTTFSLYDEVGSFETSQTVRAGGLWDVSFGYRVWRDLSVGLGVAQFQKDLSATVSGSVPHPLFYDSPRRYETRVTTSHQARAVAFLARYRVKIPGADRLAVEALGGPAHLRVRQDVIRDVSVAEVGPPFSSVNADPLVVGRAKSTIGVLVGADVSYQVHPNVGVGVLLRYIAGGVEVAGAADQRVTLDAAGFQVGGGLRLRF